MNKNEMQHGIWTLSLTDLILEGFYNFLSIWCRHLSWSKLMDGVKEILSKQSNKLTWIWMPLWARRILGMNYQSLPDKMHLMKREFSDLLHKSVPSSQSCRFQCLQMECWKSYSDGVLKIACAKTWKRAHCIQPGIAIGVIFIMFFWFKPFIIFLAPFIKHLVKMFTGTLWFAGLMTLTSLGKLVVLYQIEFCTSTHDSYTILLERSHLVLHWQVKIA